MRIHSIVVTGEQIAAGLAAMKVHACGYFEAWDVQKALADAGMSREYVGSMLADRRVSAASVAASRLIQQERKAGRIRMIGPGQWIPDASADEASDRREGKEG